MCIDLLGAEGMLYGGYDDRRDRTGRPRAPTRCTQAFLRSRANSIEGGTSEVMRNILGERVLGLPGDVRVDRDLPWNKVPRWVVTRPISTPHIARPASPRQRGIGSTER